MQHSLRFKPLPLLSFFHSNNTSGVSHCNNSTSAIILPWTISKSLLFCRSSNLSKNNGSILSSPPQMQNPNDIVAARRNRRRIRWRLSRKAALECISFIATHLKILPEPFDLILREGFAGGNGGGLGGFWNGFGGGGFEGWGSKRKKNKLGFFWLFVLCALGCWWLLLGNELESELGLGVLGLSLLGFSIGDWRKEVKSWVLGFSCCALMALLGLKRKELRSYVEGFKSHILAMENVRKKIKKAMQEKRKYKIMSR